MNSLKKTLLDWWAKIQVKKIRKKKFQPFRHQFQYDSRRLRRVVTITIFLPPSYYEQPSPRKYPLLLFNDGQDLDAINLESTLEKLYQAGGLQEILIAGIHADQDRMNLYGVAGSPDYKRRGAKAGDYTLFILRELLPFVERNYRPQAPYSFAGFSLGGLSAFDIVWNHPERFRQVGVFSGSFWWRSRPFDPKDPDADRIAHDMVRRSKPVRGLRFWFQTGTHDEASDRNNNGVIDSIDDTLDLIHALGRHKYYRDEAIRYVEVQNGEHNPYTWGKILPDFLNWAFGKEDQDGDTKTFP